MEKRTSQPGSPAGWATLTLLVLLLPFMMWMSRDYGVTWDERARDTHGRRVIDYWNGRRSIDAFKVNGSHLYGGLFDVICVLAERRAETNDFVVRHRINAAFGWLGIALCTLLARRLFGARTGLLALILLALSPRYFGEAMNNPKDLPFAALSLVPLYQFTRIRREWPYLTWVEAAWLGVAIALPLNVRPGALLYFGYSGVALGAVAIASGEQQPRRWAQLVLKVALVMAIALPLGTVTWPWALQSPFTRPFEALLSVAEFDWSGVVLFKGQEFEGHALPWDYVPVWFLITTPPVVILGLACSWYRVTAHESRWQTLGLWGMVLFPIAAVTIRGSTLYDGIRHLLFVYPVAIVIASAGWTALLARMRSPLVSRLAVASLLVGLAELLVFQVRNHPHQVVYMNAIVGGPRGAAYRFDLDYWGNCMAQATDWSARQARIAGQRLTVAGSPQHLVADNARRYRELRTSRNGEHHLEILLMRGGRSTLAQRTARPDILYRVTTADRAILCIVVPGPKYDEIAERLNRDLASAARAY